MKCPQCQTEIGQRRWLAGIVMECHSGRLQPSYFHAGAMVDVQRGALLFTKQQATEIATKYWREHFPQSKHITPFIVPYGGKTKDRIYLVQDIHKPRS